MTCILFFCACGTYLLATELWSTADTRTHPVVSNEYLLKLTQRNKKRAYLIREKTHTEQSDTDSDGVF